VASTSLKVHSLLFLLAKFRNVFIAKKIYLV
jgi:hypothetical protein